ncbi:hypothetical protein [Priestia aryabhattai]|uniref:hypothetical protein n=1 Tax=Priestia aryabhattai TaxID=412384 RepID=UPI001CCD98A2|nr:hypothetical protein [Priestia aryabhattai]MBZ6485056.1 hypothetical protein [Priestia aryabhattai]
MIDFQNFLDPYELKARLFPAILALSPLELSACLWYPKLLTIELVGINIIVLFCILFTLTKLSRAAGFKKQKKLLQDWGDFPTTIFLRHGDRTIDYITKRRYHKFLKENVQGIHIPTPEEECESPELYDNHYGSAVNWLRQNTKDKSKYDLVHKDNANYGFSRNALGLKPVGIGFCLISLCLNCLGAYQKYRLTISNIPIQIWLAVVLSLIIMLIWIFFINKNLVRNLADSYAKTLLATCDRMNNQASA